MPNTSDNYGVAFYYPYMNVQDLDWLKCVLLYWDKIRCIIPQQEKTHRSSEDGTVVMIDPVLHYEDFFTPHIQYLCDKDVIEPTEPQDYVNNAVDTFVKQLAPYKGRLSQLDIVLKQYTENDLDSLKYISIHNSKIHKKTFEEVGIKLTVGEDDFYQTQPYVAALYLTVLASEMSQRIGAPLLTDTPDLVGLSQRVLWAESLDSPQAGSETDLSELNIDFPSKINMAAFPFEKIIDFRNKRTDERRRFRKAVEDIRSTAQQIDDPNLLADYLNDQKTEIQQSLNDHKQTLHEIGIKDFTSSIKITWPLIQGITLGKLTGGWSLLLGAIGFAGISMANSKASFSLEIRKAIKDCPWHYLINLKDEFE